MQELTNTDLIGKDISIDFQKLTIKNKQYVDYFDCGHKGISEFFKKCALHDTDTVTYLFIDKDRDETIACVSICCSRIDICDNDDLLHSSIPAFEIKYFAINETYHKIPYYGKESKLTLSNVIMSKMITFIYDNCRDVIGGSKVILYSVKRAVQFYERCYFNRFESYMNRAEDIETLDCIPMYLDLDPTY